MLTYGNHFVGKRNNYGLDSIGTPYSGFGKLTLVNGTDAWYQGSNAIVVKYEYKNREYTIRHNSVTASSYDVPIGAKVKFTVSGTNDACRLAFPVADTTQFTNFNYDWVLYENPGNARFNPISRRPLYTTGSFIMKGDSRIAGEGDYEYEVLISAIYNLSANIFNNSKLNNANYYSGGVGKITVAPHAYELYDLYYMSGGNTIYTKSMFCPRITGGSALSSYGNITNVLYKRIPWSFWFEPMSCKCSYYSAFTTNRDEYIEDYVYRTAYTVNNYYSSYSPTSIPSASATYQWYKGSITAGGYQGHHTGEYGNQPLYASISGWNMTGISALDDSNFGKYDGFYNHSGVNTGIFRTVGNDPRIYASLYAGNQWNGRLINTVFELSNPLSSQQKIPAASMQKTSPANTITAFNGTLRFGSLSNKRHNCVIDPPNSV